MQPKPQDRAAALYLDLLEQTLTGAILEDVGFTPGNPPPPVPPVYDQQSRLFGRDWPSHAHTMIGLTRLRHLRNLIMQVLAENISGDFIETGVWRGGACIYMRAVLAVYGVTNRRVWVADSFEGLPAPNSELYPADTGSALHQIRYLAVSFEEVRKNFARYNMLDDQVMFLRGWFNDTLPKAPIQKLAILRLDGDLYESTIQALQSLYPKLTPGGFIIIDDYHDLPGCRKAVEDFRAHNAITDVLEDIDGQASFWRKRA